MVRPLESLDDNRDLTDAADASTRSGMKTIDISDDIYEHLLKNVKTLGEDASSILRRLLNVPLATPQTPQTRPTLVQSAAPEVVRQVPEGASGAVAECLNHPRFHVERDAVGRFLFVLGWLQKKHPDRFPRVLGLRGRKRTYFARTADELEASGESVNAQRVPDSEYWVITNNDTPKKRRIIADVMRLMGYGPGDGNQVARALE